MITYPGTRVAVPSPRLSWDMGEAVLISTSPSGYTGGPWESSGELAVVSSWVVLTGVHQTAFRSGGVVDVAPVQYELHLVHQAGMSMVSGRLTEVGLIPLTSKSDLELLDLALAAYDEIMSKGIQL